MGIMENRMETITETLACVHVNLLRTPCSSHQFEEKLASKVANLNPKTLHLDVV